MFILRRYRNKIFFFFISTAVLNLNFASADSLPSPAGYLPQSIECGPNQHGCLTKYNGGYLLPYFGSETKAIFNNAGKSDVHVTLMHGTNSYPVKTKEFAWFILVTDAVNDTGRSIPERVEGEISKIIKERLEAGGTIQDINPEPDPVHVPTIFATLEIAWSTTRLHVPSGFSIWMSRFRVADAPPPKGYACTNEDGKPQNSDNCTTHLRYWIQSIDEL